MADNPENLKLSEKQKEKILRYFNDEALLNRALAASLIRRKKSPRARAIAKGDVATIKQAIKEKISSMGLETNFHKIICEDYNWCTTRNKEFYKHIEILGPSILAQLLKMPWAYSALVFSIKRQMLNKFCNCPEVA